jgi:hypothetical protein
MSNDLSNSMGNHGVQVFEPAEGGTVAPVIGEHPNIAVLISGAVPWAALTLRFADGVLEGQTLKVMANVASLAAAGATAVAAATYVGNIDTVFNFDAIVIAYWQGLAGSFPHLGSFTMVWHFTAPGVGKWFVSGV